MPPLGSHLSLREQEVLEMIAHGVSAPQIASRMTVSHSTVRTHTRRVLTTLGVHSRPDAAALAVANRIVLPSDPQHNIIVIIVRD